MAIQVTFSGSLLRPYGAQQALSAVAEVADPAPLVVRLGHWRNRAGDPQDWRARMDATEAQFGVLAGHWRDYFGVGHNGKLGASHRQALSEGKRLFINWKPRAGGQTWADVAAGARDAVIVAAAQDWQAAFTALKLPAGALWVTWEHEPENDLGGTGSGMTAADYVAMWRRVAGLWAQHAPDVVRVCTYMSWTTGPLPGLWPGSPHVQTLGLNPYIRAGEPAAEMADRIITRSTNIRALLPGAAAMPVVITEWGPDLGGDMTTERGTDQHRAAAIDGVRLRLAEIAAAGVVELDYFDARTDMLTAAGVDQAAYRALKIATEA